MCAKPVWLYEICANHDLTIHWFRPYSNLDFDGNEIGVGKHYSSLSIRSDLVLCKYHTVDQDQGPNVWAYVSDIPASTPIVHTD